ncbi:MAG: hypothetical protein R2814_14880 [Flavobacteriaceae bacterium]
MTKQILILLWAVYSITANSQTFEGFITYKTEALNPEPTMIPDSIWQQGVKEQFGDKTYMLQKSYYKEGRYTSEIDAGKEKGFLTYSPEDGFLYSWQENSDVAVTINTKTNTDEPIKIMDSKQLDTIMGIPCKSIIVKSDTGEMVLWYNTDYFRVNPKLYKKHKYGHWNRIMEKIGSLPLKTEQKKFMSHIVQTMIDYKEMEINDKIFQLPEFKEIINAK